MPETSRTTRRLSSLLDMGFQRATPAAPTTVDIPVGLRNRKVIATRGAMGTRVTVTALVPSRDRADEAIGRAFEEMDRLVGIFSRYEPGSAVTQLNEAGRLEGAPPEFTHVVSRSLQYHTLSHGGFDLSVAPLVDLFQGPTSGSLPARSDIDAALELVGAGEIEVLRRRIGFRRSGMRITLDGIAKGYIVDAVAAMLERHRIRNYLVDAGGDIRASGTKEGKQPWSIAVQDPAKGGRYPDTIHLRRGAVATSGSYERFLDRDRLFHHIVDAGSGTSPRHSSSVSVVAPNAMAADALATAVFLMEPRHGVKFIAGLRGCECLIIDRDGRQLRSQGWTSAGPVHGAEAEA
ncbi:MAG: FAD:protein FMN transferase [Gemmatimonadales bacterium]|nr:FAD:protein FMN transferase [Gemmatimonadales bacterium]